VRNLVMLAAATLLMAGCAGQSTHYATSGRVSSDPQGNNPVVLLGDGQPWVMGETLDQSEGDGQSPAMSQEGLSITSDVAQGLGIDSQTESLDPELLYDMGRQYIEGDGVEKNIEIAKHYLGLANDLGNVEAKRVLAILALRENPADTAAIASLEEAAITSSKAKAQYAMMLMNLAAPHLNDADKGQIYLDEAFADGSHEAAYALYVLNKSKHPQQANDYLNTAAERGNPKAVVELAHAQAYTGEKTTSLKWLRAAMAENDPQAMFDYANSLMIGRFNPVLKGYSHNREIEAFYWFSKSAALGYTPAATEVKNLQGVSVAMSKLQLDPADLDNELQVIDE
jgi:TPR repeat protein